MKPLYNPLTRLVSFDWNNDEDMTETITFEPITITYIPDTQYEFCKRRLADAIWIDRGAKVGHDDFMPEILKEITVDV